MSKMISVASGFQYSVNIGYDLNNDDKLKNFIPTKSALTLLKDILIIKNCRYFILKMEILCRMINWTN